MSKIETWIKNNIPDQSGKVFVVTGATSGIGYQTALELSKKNATIILACRNIKKSKQIGQIILGVNPSANLDIIRLDLADKSSIYNFAKCFKEKYQRLDVLINNAAINAISSREETNYGTELQYGVNHLGRFILTGLLLDRLLAIENSRIVTVTTMGHHVAQMNFDDLQGIKHYNSFEAYIQSALANVLFSFELQRKLTAHKIKTRSICVHPGMVNTNMLLNMKASDLFMERFASAVGRAFLAHSPLKGALSILYGAASSQVNPNDFMIYGPGFYLRGYPKKQKASKKAYNLEDAKKLWEISENDSLIKYQFK